MRRSTAADRVPPPPVRTGAPRLPPLGPGPAREPVEGHDGHRGGAAPPGDRFSRALDVATGGLLLTTADGRVSATNEAFASALGFQADELPGGPAGELSAPEDAAADAEFARGLRAGTRQLVRREKRFRAADGRFVPAVVSSSLVPAAVDGEWEILDRVEWATATVRDLTPARRTAELSALVQEAATVANDCTGLAEAVRRLLPALRSAAPATAVRGWLREPGPAGVAGWAPIADGADPSPGPTPPAGPGCGGPAAAGPEGADPAAVGALAQPDGTVVLQVPLVVEQRVCAVLELVAARGALTDSELHRALAHVGVQLGRVAERAAAAAELTRRSLTDPLTGLGNVWQAEALLDRELARVRSGSAAAVLVVDLDRFRDVNDSVGFRAGNDVLRAVAARLASRLRGADVIARLGGDEFLVICSDLPDELLAESVARRLVDGFVEPFLAHGAPVYLTASVGIASITATSTPEMLVGNGEIAMYRAKAGGGNRYALFDTAMETEVRERLGLRHALRDALSHDELVVYYQPVIRPADGVVIGLEALVRWNRPGHGLVGPLDFIPVAEQSGLIVPLGRHVLLTAARQLAEWRAARPDLSEASIAVNVAAAQLTPDFPAMVAEVLTRTGLPADRLTLEITEGGLLLDLARTGELLSGLRRLGVTIALDDFGTGYSSLAYLRQLPIDILKIDRSFVEPFGTSPRADALVDVVLGLGHALDLSVVAEGVETVEQADGLCRRHCDALQGFYFSRPVAAAELPAVLDRLAADAAC